MVSDGIIAEWSGNMPEIDLSLPVYTAKNQKSACEGINRYKRL